VTNQGLTGFPSGASGAVADGSIPLGKLASPGGWGRLASGRYYYTHAHSSNGLTVSSTLTNGTLRLVPWIVPNAVSVSVIGGEVTSGGDAGSKLRLGVYADDGTCYPGRLLLDAGTIAGDSATVQDIAVNLQLVPGLYWIGGVVQLVTVTQPTVRASTMPSPVLLSPGTSTPAAGQNLNGYSQGSVTGALPGVFNSSITVSSTSPRIHVKIA
jgi:hypothetical protein